MTDLGTEADDIDADHIVEDKVEEHDEVNGNRLDGGLSLDLLTYLAESIVEEPDAVMIEPVEGRGGTTLRLHVAPSDMGRVIGRRGRVAQAIRTVVRAAGAKEGAEVSVDIVD